MTLGEKRVGIAFNPSGNGVVDAIKRDAADLIDNIDGMPVGNSQCGRWKAEAMTLIETGAMFAVKAATAGQDQSIDE